MTLQAPFPWFGGKSRASALIWDRLGAVPNYVEPFAGSLAVLLGRPTEPRTETVNDKDGFIANFWRALQSDPEQVAHCADWPVNENDLSARHAWLVPQRATLTARLEGDADYYDAKIAGWWVWGLCCWIGSGWCSGNGPWSVVDGQLVKDAGQGVKKQLPHLGRSRGVNRQRPHMRSQGVNRKRPLLGRGVGVNKKRNLVSWFADLSARLSSVRVCCGDWLRVMGPSPTTSIGITGIVLDPPYSEGERDMGIYAVDSGSVAGDVRRWAIAHGNDPLMRIALCGYDTEHDLPGWSKQAWTATGGYASAGDCSNVNNERETIWFSPHCLGKSGQTELDLDTP